MTKNISLTKPLTKSSDHSTKKIFGTGEWASSNLTFISGCQHDCLYCYAKAMAIRFKKKTSSNWKNENIRINDFQRKINKRKGRIFFPSSHDITPQHLDYSIQFLSKILTAGNDVLIVSKPHLECIKKICDQFPQFKSNILFRFTIGSTNSETLKFWEPNAPDFNERLESLKYAYNNGYQTSVSCEPMLDNNVEDLIEKTIEYVTNSIWLGKANRLKSILGMNGHLDEITIKKADELISLADDSRIRDLYARYMDNPKIKWKESIKKVIGIPLLEEKGLDI